LGERAHRVLFEAFGETETMQRLCGRSARLAAGQYAPRGLALDVLRVGERDADRRDAGARQEQDADQRGDRELFT